ncbi:hypothetical protein BBOV_III007150 [Babesia bovis T2Bo]|uniref:Uncharacterized protein n=1 Tax=Babesia bovis TaxID=5865 RepID=A7ANZ2_BABBO|nr:hypothetical protein BBOV_III007150 [Babesia bovis T2Bo]EDO08276.1 hypothetical protein BBOV_III007150 [Babesia bovis T2Bo]|eukprot:XP_001611844.1 hypothetical protein [Babesia bovis T2Bo]
MVFPTSPQEFCRIRNYPSEAELSSSQHTYSTSECSSSTCDTAESHKYESRRKFVGSKASPMNSLKRVSRQKSAEYKDGTPIICPNCDAMRMQLTEATTQCYDQWIKRIKVLEEMLQEKQIIIDELQAAWCERCQALEQQQVINQQLTSQLKEINQMLSDLKIENYQLKDTLQQKEELIEDLYADIKILRDKDVHNQELRQIDLQTIEDLRKTIVATKKRYRINSSFNLPSYKHKIGIAGKIKNRIQIAARNKMKHNNRNSAE